MDLGPWTIHELLMGKLFTFPLRVDGLTGVVLVLSLIYGSVVYVHLSSKTTESFSSLKRPPHSEGPFRVTVGVLMNQVPLNGPRPLRTEDPGSVPRKEDEVRR